MVTSAPSAPELMAWRRGASSVWAAWPGEAVFYGYNYVGADAAMRREADARMNECMTGPFWEDSTKVPFCYRPPFLKMDN